MRFIEYSMKVLLVIQYVLYNMWLFYNPDDVSKKKDQIHFTFTLKRLRDIIIF